MTGMTPVFFVWWARRGPEAHFFPAVVRQCLPCVLCDEECQHRFAAPERGDVGGCYRGSGWSKRRALPSRILRRYTPIFTSAWQSWCVKSTST